MHAIPRWNAVAGFLPKPQDPNVEHGKADPDPAFTEVFSPESKRGLPDSYRSAKQPWKEIAPDGRELRQPV